MTRRLVLASTGGVVLAVVCAITTPAGAVIWRDDKPESSYTTLAADPDYAAVGVVKNGEGEVRASGVLISPTWVITAAHYGQGSNPRTFTVDGETRVILNRTRHPNWIDTPDPAEGYDLALLHLDKPITNIAIPELYTALGEVGMVGTYVGYGLGGDGDSGEVDGTDDVKRAGQNIISKAGGSIPGIGGSFSSNVLLADFDKPTFPGSSTATGSYSKLTGALQDLENMIATGDSGGGVFIEIAGTTYLAAVHSAAISFDPGGDNGIPFDYGDILLSTRIQPSLGWIETLVTIGVDFNDDGFIDDLDIDELFAQVPGSVPPVNAMFDLDDNNLVNDDDVDLMLASVFETVRGDFNLDGMVTLDDYDILSGNYHTPGGWGDGDATGDGFIDFEDFVTLALHFGYGASETLGQLTVLPEPTTLAFICIGAFALTRRR